MLSIPLCAAQIRLSKEEIRSQLENFDGYELAPFIQQIRNAFSSEQERILDIVIQIAREEALGATRPFMKEGSIDPDGRQSRRAVENVSHILGELGNEKAILDAFAATFPSIEPSTRTGVAFTLAKCKDPIALGLIEQSAREQAKFILSFDLSSLTENEQSLIEESAIHLSHFLEAMIMSNNASGEIKAHEILIEFETKARRHPLTNQVALLIRNNLEKELGRKLESGISADTAETINENSQKRESSRGRGANRSGMPVNSWCHIVYPILAFIILGLGIAILRSRVNKFHG